MHGVACPVESLFCNTTRHTGGKWDRVDISGDCSIVPTRIPRKQAPPRKQKKDVLRAGFICTPTGPIEDCFGFILDGDQRHPLDDFTVTHAQLRQSYLLERAGPPGQRAKIDSGA
jgi:hypothetical protein